jgi:RNA polymerase sigma factor, sigma-70 family
VQGWLSGNSSSGEKLVTESYDKVSRLIAIKINPGTRNYQETIEEITEESFTRAFGKIHSYNGSCSFYTWVCGFAKNCVNEKFREIYRDLKQPEFKEEVEYFEEYDMDAFDNPEEAVCRKEEYEAVRSAFLSLQSDYREILHFRLIKGLKYDAISHLSGKSIDNLESLFRRALKALKKQFDNFY